MDEHATWHPTVPVGTRTRVAVMGQTETGVAVVGAGRWGRNLLRVLTDRARVPVVCHAGDPETAAYLDEHYPSIDRVTDYQRALTDSRIDAVALATPTETHARFARRALENGTHVFVEKPIATAADAAADVARVAASSEAVCFVGYVFCHHPLIDRLRRIHDSDPITDVRAHWHKTGTFGSDVRHQLLSHHVAIAELLYGNRMDIPPNAGGGSPSSPPPERGPEVRTIDRFGRAEALDRLSVSLDYGGGRYLATVDRLSPDASHVIVVRTTSGDVLAWEDDQLTLFDGGRFRTVTERSREPLAVELLTFLDCIEAGQSPSTDARFGARVARIIDRVGGHEPDE